MDLGDLNKVWEIKTLKKIGEDEAQRILQKVAQQVRPIMKKHKWRVKILSEFCPVNSSLLGLNEGGGVQVKLRLRKPNRDWEFFPYEQILDTMLHELCHNEHGPHNASFYKLWDEIRKECEELMAKRITGTGQGFDAPGRRLGGFSRPLPLSSLRQTALAAAERRAGAGAIFPVGPKRLGGDSDIMSALSPIQAAAMAAERRLQDDLWCGSQAFPVDPAPGQCSKNSKNSVTLKTDSSMAKPVNNVAASSVPSSEDGFMGVSTSGSVLDCCQTDKAEGGIFWECGTCTLFNQAKGHAVGEVLARPFHHYPFFGQPWVFPSTPIFWQLSSWFVGKWEPVTRAVMPVTVEPLALVCDACGAPKPKDVRTKFKIWSCKFCTLENSVELDRCLACQQWRYSYGAPVATHGPNLGT